MWLILVLLTILLWSASCLLFKAGFIAGDEKYICLKFSVCVGIVFFVIGIIYLIIRDEPFTIWQSALRFWPVPAFGVVYAVVNTVSYKGYVYNEATVEAPLEGISGGVSTILLIGVYFILGRVSSVAELLTPLRTAGILVILFSVIALAVVRNRNNRKKNRYQNAKWIKYGLGTLIFPVIFSIIDALETIITGICLDTTYGYAMPEGDSIIIIGMEYAIFAFGCWIYILIKEKKAFNPFTKKSAPMIMGAVTDNVGIVLYSYAMAMNSISTDPLLALYPIFAMIGGRILLKEKVSRLQYMYLIGIVAGSVMVVVDTMR